MRCAHGIVDSPLVLPDTEMDPGNEPEIERACLTETSQLIGHPWERIISSYLHEGILPSAF